MLLWLLLLSHVQHFFRIQPGVIFQQRSSSFPSLEMQASYKNPSTICYQRIHMKPNLKNILVCSCRDATARQSQLYWKQQFCWSHCHHPSPLFFCGKVLLSQHQPIRWQKFLMSGAWIIHPGTVTTQLHCWYPKAKRCVQKLMQLSHQCFFNSIVLSK